MIHCRPWLLFCLLSSLGVASPCQQKEEAPPVLPERVRSQVDGAVAKFAAARTESAATVHAELDSEILRICADTRIGLDERVATAVALRQQLARFESDGTEPKAAQAAVIVERHGKRVAAARAACEAVFDRIAEDLLATDLGLARTVLAEKQSALGPAARTTSPDSAPDVVAIGATILATDTLPEPLPEALMGRAQTIRAAAAVLQPARVEHRQAIERARKPVLDELAQIEKRLAANKKLTVEERLTKLDTLRAERDTFEGVGVLPSQTQLSASVARAYERQVAVADQKLRAGHDAAAEKCIVQDLEIAQAVMRLRDAAGGPPGVAAPANGAALVPEGEARCAVVLAGIWQISADEIVQSGKGQRPLVLSFGDPTWTEYDLTVEGLMFEGESGFKVQFHRQNAHNYREFTVGNYANQGGDVARVWRGKWSRQAGDYRPQSIEAQSWYALKLEVRGPRVRCFVDGEQWFDSRDEDLVAGQIALACWDTKARFRNILVQDPQGRVLWRGLPTLPE